MFCGTNSDILRQPLHFADQSLNGLSTPDLQTTPQRAQMAAAIESRITSLKFGEEFHSCLIRTRFQTLLSITHILRPATRDALSVDRLEPYHSHR